MIDSTARAFAEKMLKEWIDVHGKALLLRKLLTVYAQDDGCDIGADLRRAIIDVVLKPAPKAPAAAATPTVVYKDAEKRAPRQAKAAKLPLWTPERLAVLDRDWPTMRPMRDIHRDINALPGAERSKALISVQAYRRGLRRPEEMRAEMAKRVGKKPIGSNGAPAPEAPAHAAPKPPKPNPTPVTPRTLERLALVEEAYTTSHESVESIIARCNKLPGPPVTPKDVLAWVVARGHRRPTTEAA